MNKLKKVPKHIWIAGGLGLAIGLVIIYMRNREKGLSEDQIQPDPCDPYGEYYNPAECPPESIYSGKGGPGAGSGGSAAGTGMVYYLPYPEAEKEVEEKPSEAPTEENSTVVTTPGTGNGSPPPPFIENSPIVNPANTGGGVTGSIGGVPVGIGGAMALPPAPPVAVAPAIQAPSGWCGHPNAVGVNRPCADKTKINPPPGWHWFCCNGSLGRAPN